MAPVRAFVLSFLAFAVTDAPYSLSPVLFKSPGWRSLPTDLVFILPYAGPVVAGLVLSYLFPQNKTKHAVLLGSVIAFAMAAFNFVAPYIGLWSDFPGLYASSWLFIIYLPFTIFLVIAGTGLRGLWEKNAQDT